MHRKKENEKKHQSWRVRENKEWADKQKIDAKYMKKKIFKMQNDWKEMIKRKKMKIGIDE